MKTTYLNNEKIPKGTLAFNGNIMATFGENQKFYVLNGAWSGTLKNNYVLIYNREDIKIKTTFRKVTYLTKLERKAWYVRDAHLKPEIFSLC